MAVQFLILRRNGALSDSKWLKLISLRHHLGDLKKKDSNELGDFGLMAKAVQKYSGTKEDLSLVESLLGRVRLFLVFSPRNSLKFIRDWAGPENSCSDLADL